MFTFRFDVDEPEKSRREATHVQESKQQKIKESAKEYIQWNPTQRPIRQMFTENVNSPVKVFEWIEEDYQGSMVVVYKYNFQGELFYLVFTGSFGSCSGCDAWYHLVGDDLPVNDDPSVIDYIQRTFNDVMVCNSITQCLQQNVYLHPECKSELLNFQKTEMQKK